MIVVINSIASKYNNNGKELGGRIVTNELDMHVMQNRTIFNIQVIDNNYDIVE